MYRRHFQELVSKQPILVCQCTKLARKISTLFLAQTSRENHTLATKFKKTVIDFSSNDLVSLCPYIISIYDKIISRFIFKTQFKLSLR